MATRLGEYVVYGELRNTGHYATSGALVLRGPAPEEEVVLRFSLTGDCAADLRGRHVRFWPSDEQDARGLIFSRKEFATLQPCQVGPTGDMTAAGWVRVMPCSVGEFLRHARLGEPPPTTWQRRLYLEWYSQNGRVVVEMPGAVVEECVREPGGKDDEGEWAELPNPAPMPDASAARQPSGLEVTAIEETDGDLHVDHWTIAEASDAVEEDAPGVDPCGPDTVASDGRDDDDYGVDAVGRDPIEELELLDDCLEQGDGTPLSSLLGDVDKMPRAEDLDDESVEAHLKMLLARMAAINVVLDVCEHFTPRDCYRLLLSTIIPESSAYEELIGSGQIQHEMTAEHCPDCDLQIELEMGDFNEEKPQEPTG